MAHSPHTRRTEIPFAGQFATFHGQVATALVDVRAIPKISQDNLILPRDTIQDCVDTYKNERKCEKSVAHPDRLLG